MPASPPWGCVMALSDLGVGDKLTNDMPQLCREHQCLAALLPEPAGGLAMPWESQGTGGFGCLQWAAWVAGLKDAATSWKDAATNSKAAAASLKDAIIA